MQFSDELRFATMNYFQKKSKVKTWKKIQSMYIAEKIITPAKSCEVKSNLKLVKSGMPLYGFLRALTL